MGSVGSRIGWNTRRDGFWINKEFHPPHNPFYLGWGRAPFTRLCGQGQNVAAVCCAQSAFNSWYRLLVQCCVRVCFGGRPSVCVCSWGDPGVPRANGCAGTHFLWERNPRNHAMKILFGFSEHNCMLSNQQTSAIRPK